MPSTSLPASERRRRLARLEEVADQLDSRFRVPGLGIRFGWDSIIGLVPGVGDLLMAAPSAWMIHEGHKLGASKRVLAQMTANAGIDFFVGGVPVLGDAFDLFFKSHRRNLALLRTDVERLDAADAQKKSTSDDGATSVAPRDTIEGSKPS